MTELWMHGLGADPENGAKHLKDLGFKAVVGGASSSEAVLSQGMDYYICSGAYRGPAFKGEEWLAQDPWGNKHEWFGSTCPTRKEVRSYNLEQIRRMAATPGIKGILIDGARFASPTSGKTTDALFTCFCPECMAKAKSMGFDVDEMKMAVATLHDFVHGKKLDLLPFYYGIQEWLQFRRAATTEHLLDFVKTVKEVNPALRAGIYIFAPALSDLVGQNYRDLQGKMDIIAPMLYRCYEDPNGPACLNVELADMLRMLEKAADLTEEQRIRMVGGFVGHELTGYEKPEDMMAGLSTRILKRETQRARIMCPNEKLVPIIQLDDPLLDEAIDQTMAGGAEAVNFFVYDEQIVENNRKVWEKLRE